MPLIKIPCILVAMVGLQITVTPPHPPPALDEEAASTSLEIFLKQRFSSFVISSICWAAAIAEAAVIVASHYPDRAPSQKILSMLTIERTAKNIHFSLPFLVGTSLAGLGGYIRYKCYHELGKLFTFEMSIRKNHKLVTSGPYSVVRHPGYTGAILTVIGIVCWHACPGSWARECGAFNTKTGQGAAGIFVTMVSVIATGLLARMSKEDEALKKTFGQDWVEWVAKVPYKLVPGVY